MFLIRLPARSMLLAAGLALAWLGLLLVTVWLISSWLPLHAAATNSPLPPPQPQADAMRAAQSIAARHLMGLTQVRLAEEAVPDPPRYRLLGAMTSSRQGRGFVVLAEEGKPMMAVLEGEELADGVTVSRIFADKVVLGRAGTRETLDLSYAPNRGPATGPLSRKDGVPAVMPNPAPNIAPNIAPRPAPDAATDSP